MGNRYFNNYKFNGVFLRTFILLILTSIIPMIAANWIIYNQATSVIQKQAMKMNMDMLGKTNQAVDIIYNETEKILNVSTRVKCPGIAQVA